MIMTCTYRIYCVWTLDNTRLTNLSFNYLLSCYTFGLEPIRAINNLIVDLLNVAGCTLSSHSEYCHHLAVIITWKLSIRIHWGFGYTGIILVSIADEALRFIIMYLRWRKDRWQARMKQIGV